MNEADDRKLCVLYMSCLGEGLAYLLPFSKEFNRRYRIVPHLSFQMETITKNVHLPAIDIEHCEVFVYHNPEWIVLFSPEDLIDYERILSSLPSSATKISFPLAQFHPFWPFHTNDPRDTASSRVPDRYGDIRSYPYGDVFLMDQLNKGAPQEVVLRDCLSCDVASLVDLDAMLDWSISYMARNERNCNIKISEYVAAEFRRLSLFSTINHVSNELLVHMTNEILDSLSCDLLDTSLSASLQPLVGFEMPIHPSIGAHFKIEYISSNARYIIDRLRSSTYEQYISDYIYLR